MANPEFIEELDSFDRLTVRLYRAGLTGCSIFLTALAMAKLAASFPEALGLSSFDGSDYALRFLWLGLAISVAIGVVHLHIYDRKIRWFVHNIAWVGVFIHLGWAYSGEGTPLVFFVAGSGFTFAVLSTFAMKEQHCFKIPIIKAIPVLLILALFPLLFNVLWASGVLLLLAGLIYLVMVIAKWRMPLHFDIGEKAKYQI